MTIQNAMAAISDFIDNPTDSEVAESTMETLNKALEDAETEQVQVIKNALSLINKIQGLHTHTNPLLPKAAHYMAVYEAFMDVINPLIDPFQYTEEA